MTKPPDKASHEDSSDDAEASQFKPDPEERTSGEPFRHRDVHLRMFFELTLRGFRTLLLMNFEYDEELDWYELKVARGQDVIAYMHGYGNHGWNPQVNNIWVSHRFRRKGVGSFMMSRVEQFFGQVPLPGTPISDNEPARLFWKNYLTGRSKFEGNGGEDPSMPDR